MSSLLSPLKSPINSFAPSWWHHLKLFTQLVPVKYLDGPWLYAIHLYPFLPLWHSMSVRLSPLKSPRKSCRDEPHQRRALLHEVPARCWREKNEWSHLSLSRESICFSPEIWSKYCRIRNIYVNQKCFMHLTLFRPSQMFLSKLFEVHGLFSKCFKYDNHNHMLWKQWVRGHCEIN